MNDSQLAMLGVLTALNKMMRGQYFDITVIDSAVKAVRAQPDGRAYEILRTVHCVHWADMPAELRDPRPLPFVPWKGQLSFFDVPRDALREAAHG